jgi:hypothetical protein
VYSVAIEKDDGKQKKVCISCTKIKIHQKKEKKPLTRAKKCGKIRNEG